MLYRVVDYGKDGDTDCVLQKYWARIEVSVKHVYRKI